MIEFCCKHIWRPIPPAVQKIPFKAFTSLLNLRMSKCILKPYQHFHYKGDLSYLNQFCSSREDGQYRSFQDFFTRRYKTHPRVVADNVWHCEGVLYESKTVREVPQVKVKGQLRNIRTIFGKFGSELKEEDHYTNVFLHNKDYHRIHSPTKMRVLGYERIRGKICYLRPWIYKDFPSYPALFNERVNLKLEDRSGRPWYMSIVGGPGVATIEMGNDFEIGAEYNAGDEIALFLAGSTCCMVSPVKPTVHEKQRVSVALPY